MRKIHCIILGLLFTMIIMAQELHFAATDSRITYVGRVAVQGQAVSFDWTGTYLRIAFEGKSLKLVCSDTKKDYLSLWLDKEMTDTPDQVLSVMGDTVLVLSDQLNTKRNAHQVILQKRTEGEQGRLTIHEVIAAGELLPATPLKERQLEFIGDSYTCGFGAEESLINDPFTPETENAGKSFAAILSRWLDADYVMIAHSGMGVCRNYNSKFADYYMPERYLQTFDMSRGDSTRWNAQRDDFRPALTVIFLGSNDFSVGKTPNYKSFEEQYLTLLRAIRANYGEQHPILCCSKKGLTVLQQYINKMLKASKMENVYYAPCHVGLFPDDEKHLGACKHPSYEAHKKVATMLLPYVCSITGWDLPE